MNPSSDSAGDTVRADSSWVDSKVMSGTGFDGEVSGWVGVDSGFSNLSNLKSAWQFWC